jgi:hypothetical protein
MKFGEWPGFQGLRVLMLWVILVFVVFGWRYYWRATRAVADEAAGVSFSFTGPLLVAFGPPLLVVIGYSLFRRKAGKP